MKILKPKTIQKVDDIICDVCGISCKKDGCEHEYASLEAIWGYCSQQDGRRYDIDLCESCFRSCVKSLKLMRESTLYKPEKDFLNGFEI